MKYIVKKSLVFLVFLILLSIGFQGSMALSSGANGVDSIRGQWEILVSEPESAENFSLIIFINDLVFRQESEDFVAGGCMETVSSGGITPVSLRAIPTGPNDFEVSILGTVQSIDESPFIIQLNGTIRAYGPSLPDDIAGSDVNSQSTHGWSWEGYHKNRRRKKCPPAQIPPLEFRVDVSAQPDFDGENIVYNPTWVDSDGTIVAAAMKVRAPDGSEFIVEPYTDIFSPQVDFISRFRFGKLLDKEPIPGVYTFSLLDAAGNEIPGTTSTDTFTECRLTGGPKNLSAAINGQDVILSWEGPSIVPGFDPLNGAGFYDIVTYLDGNGTKYAANLITDTSHYIPWTDFEEGSQGFPSGNDYGLSLSELPDGTYGVIVPAHAVPSLGDPGNGLECNARDINEVLYFTKQGSQITIP